MTTRASFASKKKDSIQQQASNMEKVDEISNDLSSEVTPMKATSSSIMPVLTGVKRADHFSTITPSSKSQTHIHRSTLIICT